MTGTASQIGRNDPCPCGSGRKYKKCCWGKAARSPARTHATPPPNQRELIQLAADHAQAGRLDQARHLYEQVLRSSPRDINALYGLAELLGRLNKTPMAIELLRRAIAVQERHADLHILLSYLLMQSGDVEGALKSARRAITIDPKKEAAYRMLADCHHRMHRLDEAIAAAGKALSVDPESANAEIFLASLLMQKGDLADARSRLDNVLKRDLHQDLIHRALTELGFVLDKLGEYDAAFEAFERAGAESGARPEAKVIDRTVSFDLVDDYRAVATRELLSKWTRETIDDGRPAPLFLVGFPRSGTTLTEQIIAAHPDVVTADEKQILGLTKSEMARWFSEENVPGMLAQLDRDDIRRIRSAYWTHAESIMQTDLAGKTFIDKLPLNIVDMPLINVVFPDARVIVALRDPRDVCLSCFMQRFGLNTAMINFLEWEQTAAYYARVMGFWLHLRDVVTLDFIEVRYEDTVEDFENQARRLLDFLGVPWDENVLNFHEHARKRFVSTPSFTAVSEPVHRRAAGRWRNYATHVQRISETLAPFIAAFGYE